MLYGRVQSLLPRSVRPALFTLLSQISNTDIFIFFMLASLNIRIDQHEAKIYNPIR